ncbi:RluA family pseudouridine synthase [Lentilactobacillus sp. SPB1-3]|uniref:RluA family pseudouridine synthase n=1 Tax=Lentilactobacillus terminaliae TaxID=3003483 RepID=A0ACD5DFN6_9LACO|nr:RluA family pseudouridine synthase [Lentilactobacillus sp. SPB1-3]MCZ0976718.1 RluA family pseudouridine synthase [Lentilactobacillus sp. SPB1-3]
MKIDFEYNEGPTEPLKKFLNSVGVSHRMYKDLRDGEGSFYLNHQLVTDVRVSEGDVVTVEFPPEQSDPNIAASDGELTIMYEDQNWLLVNKPAGLTVVPGPANRDDTLVNRIKGHWLSNNEENLVPHIITRLDRFTSGVVLIAKHRLANSLANQLMEDNQLFKEYVAVASGTGLADHAEINKPIGKRETGFGQTISPDGKFARTEYWKIQDHESYTTVRVVIHTGRTHQIRVHFASIDHPLLGDELYSGPMDLGIQRQALHAGRLSFDNPFSGEKLAVEADVPADMKQYFD